MSTDLSGKNNEKKREGNRKEELSALIDGEASELELRRLLKSVSEKKDLQQSWSLFHLIRSVMHKESVAGLTVDISTEVSQALDVEPCYGPSGEGIQKTDQQKFFFTSIVKPLSSAVIAATVTLIVVFGWQNFNSSRGLQPGSSLTQTTNVLNDKGFVLASQNSSNLTPSHYARSQTYDVQQRLRAYIITHSENSAMHTGRGIMPYARMVSMEPSRNR